MDIKYIFFLSKEGPKYVTFVSNPSRPLISGRFLMKGTFTGKLATVKEDGSSHVVPIWFVLEKKKRE